MTGQERNHKERNTFYILLPLMTYLSFFFPFSFLNKGPIFSQLKLYNKSCLLVCSLNLLHWLPKTVFTFPPCSLLQSNQLLWTLAKENWSAEGQGQPHCPLTSHALLVLEYLFPKKQCLESNVNSKIYSNSTKRSLKEYWKYSRIFLTLTLLCYSLMFVI